MSRHFVRRKERTRPPKTSACKCWGNTPLQFIPAVPERVEHQPRRKFTVSLAHTCLTKGETVSSLAVKSIVIL